MIKIECDKCGNTFGSNDSIICQNCRNDLIDENERFKDEVFQSRKQIRKMDKEIELLKCKNTELKKLLNKK